MGRIRTHRKGKHTGQLITVGVDEMPPHNRDAERCVLGAMLRDNGTISDVCQAVSKEDFHAYAHQAMFDAIVCLHDRGESADLVSVADLLRERDQIEDIGGYGLLAEVWDANLIPASWPTHGRIVREHALRRRLIHAGYQIIRDARDGRGPAAELLEAAKQEIDVLGRGVPKHNLLPDPTPASELAADGNGADWVLQGYLARGSVTLLVSRWKAGKSTLLAHIVKALGMGGELAGLRVSAGGVLVVSEESPKLWGQRRDKLGIGDHVLFYTRPFKGRPDWPTWRAYVRHLASLTKKRSLVLVCLDTFAALNPCQDENDAAEMQAALLPLHEITEAGAAVLLNHHPHKGDSGEGQLSRGSGALPAFADIIVEMRRYGGGGTSTRQRSLTAYSRFEDTPAELVIELTEDGRGYRALGAPSEADRGARWAALADLLPRQAPGATGQELLENWPADRIGKPPGRRTLDGDLQQGAEAGRWSMAGAGVRGDPYRFWRNGTP